MKRGFTLLETVIYIALLGIVGGGLTLFMFSLSDARESARDVEEVAAGSRTIVQALGYAIRGASAIITPADGATMNGLVGNLVIDAQGADPNITFRIENGVLKRIVGVGTPEIITPSWIIFDELTYTNTSTSGERDNVRVQMRLRAGNTTQAYQFSVSVRP